MRIVLLFFIVNSIVFMSYGQNLVTKNESSEGLIARIWHGWTTPENASAFEDLLTKEAIPSIENGKIDGLKGIQLLKRDVGNEVEFTTIMWFENLEAVKKFAGEDYEKAHIDPVVAPLLLRYDPLSAHSFLQFSSFIRK
jgi:hypothetical protein